MITKTSLPKSGKRSVVAVRDETVYNNDNYVKYFLTPNPAPKQERIKEQFKNIGHF